MRTHTHTHIIYLINVVVVFLFKSFHLHFLALRDQLISSITDHTRSSEATFLISLNLALFVNEY